MKTPLECRSVDERLLAFAAGELPATTSHEVRAHLETCATCSAVLAEIQQTRALAATQQLTSPVLDRYAEFLRRLTAPETSTALTTQPARSLTPPANHEQYGLAAALPLLGNRLLVRQGFGRGFEVQLVSRQGGELFRLTAQSLARVAATVAGMSAFAGAIGAVLFFLFTARQEVTHVPPPSPVAQPPVPAPALQRDWVQTVNGKLWSLVLWQHGGQLHVGLYPNNDPSQLAWLALALPSTSAGSAPAFLRPVECAAATDGESFVLLAEVQQMLFTWHIQPQTAQSSAPLALGLRGAQPALAWAADRYVVTYIETVTPAPKIKLLILDRNGQVSAAAAETIVAETQNYAKVGSPAVFARGTEALIVYHRQGSTLFGRRWSAQAGSLDSEFALGVPPRRLVNRPFMADLEDGYLICWADTAAQHTRIQCTVLNQAGQPVRNIVLTERPTILLDLAYRLTASELTLLWTETAGQQTLFLTQPFNLEGVRHATAQQLLATGEAGATAASFADARGEQIWWLTPGRATAPLQHEPLTQALSRATNPPFAR